MANEPKENGRGKHFKLSLAKQSREFTWEIDNFQLWPHDAKKNTPNFSLEPNLIFYATLQVKKDEYYGNLYVHLSFHLVQGEDTRINHIAAVEDGGELTRGFASKSHMYNSDSKVCELGPLTMKLLDNSKDRFLTFKWTMEFVRFTEDEPSKHVPRPQEVNMLNLTNQLKEMYAEAQNADTTLKVGDVNVPVHKCILAKRSPVFAKMFEANEIEYDIPDLESSVLKRLIEFLYSATVYEDNFESFCDLYYAADVYQVDDLRTTCVSVLLSKLDVGNACQALVLACDRGHHDFKKSVMDFIVPHFNEIVKTAAWKKFVKEQTSLAAEVIETHLGNY